MAEAHERLRVVTRFERRGERRTCRQERGPLAAELAVKLLERHVMQQQRAVRLQRPAGAIDRRREREHAQRLLRLHEQDAAPVGLRVVHCEGARVEPNLREQAVNDRAHRAVLEPLRLAEQLVPLAAALVPALPVRDLAWPAAVLGDRALGAV